jgi:3-dehydroquinate dehydratase-2
MDSVLILHGPNLNLLGEREPGIYGQVTMAEIDRRLAVLGEELGLSVRTYQSNSEGALIDALQRRACGLKGSCLIRGGIRIPRWRSGTR